MHPEILRKEWKFALVMLILSGVVILMGLSGESGIAVSFGETIKFVAGSIVVVFMLGGTVLLMFLVYGKPEGNDGEATTTYGDVDVRELGLRQEQSHSWQEAIESLVKRKNFSASKTSIQEVIMWVKTGEHRGVEGYRSPDDWKELSDIVDNSK